MLLTVTSVRPIKDETYLEMVHVLKKRGTCSRAQHAAIIVKDDAVVGWGYNGAPFNCRHCDHGFRECDCGMPTLASGSSDPEERRRMAYHDNGCASKVPGDLENGHCVNAVHAEVNAIAMSARKGHATEGGVMYVTANPCYACAKVIIQAGIREVVFDTEYRWDNRSIAIFANAGIQWRKVG